MNDLLELLDNGFHFEYGNQKHIEIVNNLIKNPNLEEILDKITNINDIVFVISNTSIHKLVLLRTLINNNLTKVRKIIKNPYIEEKHINFIIDSIPLEYLKDNLKVIEYAIEKGYIVNEYTLELIENNKELLIKQIEKINNLEALLNLINSLSETTLNDSLIVNLAITKGYYFTKNTPDTLKNNKEVLKRILGFIYSKDNNNFYVAETINNCNPNILDEQILNIAKEKLGYTLNINSPLEKINEIYEKYYNDYIKQFTNKTKEKYIKLSQKLGKGIIYFERENSLFSKKIIDTFGEIAISKIYKYHNLLGKKIDFENLIRNNNLEKFKYLFTVISDNSDNFKTFDMVLFLNFLNKYEKYGNLCFEYISSNGINEETRKILKKLLINKYENLEIKDLNNIDLIIKENNNRIIESNNILEIKNIIYLMLCNLTSEELNKMFYSINKKSLTKLKNELNDNNIKLILDKYILLINFLEYIKNCNNLDKLKVIASKINNFEKIEIIRQNFIEIFENIKYFYGLEINQKLTKINTLKQNDKKDINGVKYIDCHENCIFFQHVMNAFGKGGLLLDYKKPKLVGQTRLCLSLISNNIDGILRVPIDSNHVTLIFDNINPKGLLAMDSRDIGSSTDINSLTLFYNMYAQFNIVSDMLEKTKKTQYNEYNVYIENEDGTNIYPSAVRITGDIPNEAEIEAASILQIPLIKINKIKTLETTIESKNIDYNQSQIEQLEILDDIFTELKDEKQKKI